MREIKARDIYLPDNIKALLDWENKDPEELIQVFNMVETVPEMIKHINKHYKGSNRLAGNEWGVSNQFINMIKNGDRGVSKNIAPYFDNFRLPAQGEFIRL